MNKQILQPDFLYWNEIPSRAKGKVRIWSEPEVKFIKKWLVKIKRNYRKEFAVGSILLLALIPSPTKAMGTKPVVSPEVKPAYIKPITPIAPVQAIAVVVPSEVSPVPEPVAPPPPVAPVNNAPSGCGDNFYANYIYSHESGCRTDAIGPNGPCGLGQALPCSKMGCSLSDYACQNQFFTNYAIQRYGSWEAAYNYWVLHKNW